MKRKIKKTEIVCNICEDIVEQNGFVLKSYTALKGKSFDYVDVSALFWFREEHTHSNNFHICHQCLHDLGTLVKRLREEKKEVNR